MQKIAMKLSDEYLASVKDIGYPNFKKKGDAGIDLRILGVKDSARQNIFVDELMAEPNIIYTADTGISVAIPEGWCGIVYERSGLGTSHGVSLHGRVVDSGYRGKIYAVFTVKKPLHLEKHMRIAQIVFMPVLTNIHFVDEWPDEIKETERGDTGFGSSGLI